MLRSQGWESRLEALEPWSIDGPLHFLMVLKRPVSYFVALLSRASILEKGVASIRHDASDGYYQCLIHVLGPKLLEILDASTQQARLDDWFKALLVADGEMSGNASGDEVDDEAVLALPPPRKHMAHAGGIIPVETVSNLWIRCNARRPGHEDLKIYFDGASGGDGRQRGWTYHAGNDIRLYRHCDHFASREHFAAWMALWHSAGVLDVCNTRESHFNYLPLPDDVAALARSIVLVQF